MPNIAKVLKEEVQRLAKKQVKTGLAPIRRDNIRLKKVVADLRRDLSELNRTHRVLAAKMSGFLVTKETEAAQEKAPTLRPTSRSLAKLRGRLDLTQAEFAKLLGVSNQAVTYWEGRGARVRMRPTNLAALAAIQKIGKREARRRLDGMGEG